MGMITEWEGLSIGSRIASPEFQIWKKVGGREKKSPRNNPRGFAYASRGRRRRFERRVILALY
jgi:hypothetical protein